MPVQVRPAVPEAASGDNRPFWAIFLCEENSPQRRYAEALRLPGELSSLRALSHSAILTAVSLANAKITCVERDPIVKHRNDLIGRFCSINDNPADNLANNHINFATHHFHLLSRSAFTLATKGYLRPLTSRESLVVSYN